MSDIKDKAMKALKCLYIAVEEPVADDVNASVKAYIEQLEAQNRELRRYSEHVMGCAAIKYGDECDCGLEQVLTNAPTEDEIRQNEREQDGVADASS